MDDPLPPSALAERELPLRILTDPVLYRGHRAHNAPLFFNTTDGRWTDPGSDSGTLYLGETPTCAFAEAFVQVSDGAGFPVHVSETFLRSCCLCPVKVSGELKLVDVTSGPALLAIGADGQINTGPHSNSRLWARAFVEHLARPDGIYYRSRRSPELFSIALFGRATAKLSADCEGNLLAHADRLAEILEYFDCALLP